MAFIESIPQNIKKEHEMCQKQFFIILATVISGMPTPEICFSQGQLRARQTILSKKRYSDSLSGRGSKTQPSSL